MHSFVRRLAFQADPKRLWRRYLFAIAIIMVMIVVSHTVQVMAFHAARDDAAIINESGRQRMLSQRILYFATAYHKNADPQAAISLEDAIARFAANHQDLIRQVDLSQAQRALYFEGDGHPSLNDLMTRYVADARQVLGQAPGAARALVRMQRIGADRLLTLLDQAVHGFETEANAKAERLQMIRNTSLLAALGILILEVGLIFFPAHVAAKRALEKLEDQATDLKKVSDKAMAHNAQMAIAKAELEYSALHDPLTGLANRRHLDLTLEQMAEQASKDGLGIAMLHVDLDRFKQINDTLGHAAGDFILGHVASVLKAEAHADDLVARVGGDEFVIARITDGTTESLAVLASRIVTALSSPVFYESALCRFGASIGIGIGIAVETGGKLDPAKLQVNADIALYKAKEKGRGRYEFFSKEMEKEVIRVKRISDEILNGLENGEFVPFYQLQFDARTHRPVGVETLARWRHPRDGLLMPNEFLRIAKDLNVIAQLDRIMLEQALKDRETWRKAGYDIPMLSVNVTAQRLQDQKLIDDIRELKIEPGRVAFELMESIFFDECDPDIERAVRALKRYGAEIEIDDFGTGHSSIVSLINIRPDRLKIDQQLVFPITQSQAQRDLVASVIGIGKALQIGVVAEGVETMQHARILADMGCDVLQGYAFATPKTPEETMAFLKSDTIRSAS